MSSQFITSDRGDDGIVVVTINDPEAKTAVTWVMNQELIAECNRIDADPKARVLAVTGTGRMLRSGGNIKRMTAEVRRNVFVAPYPAATGVTCERLVQSDAQIAVEVAVLREAA